MKEKYYYLFFIALILFVFTVLNYQDGFAGITSESVFPHLFTLGIGLLVFKISFYQRKRAGGSQDEPYVTQGTCELCHSPCTISELTYMDPQKGFSTFFKSSKTKKLCREHFIQEYRDAFLTQKSTMLVMKPDVRNSSRAYFFATLSDLPNIGLDSDDMAVIQSILANIPEGKECAYMDEGALFSDDYTATTPKLFGDTPIEYLSRKEAWERIEEEFTHAQKDFLEGFNSVYRNEQGMFMNMSI